jgi:CYTH domain-containing protein
MMTHRIGKYGCLEAERRYLLTKVPADLPDHTGWQISDRYFSGTRLRLRRMQSLSGAETLYKLTQKFRASGQKLDETTITNFYLTEAEYNLFSPLEASLLRKTRFSYPRQGHRFSIDVFEGRHQGLILAEVEFEPEGTAEALALPAFAVRDVTDEAFFLGGSLAFLTEEEFQKGLLQYLRK